MQASIGAEAGERMSRYILLSTPQGHEWEHPYDLIVDTETRQYTSLWAYEPNDEWVAKLNNLTVPRYAHTWSPWSDYALDVNEERWEEYHGETFAATTARLFGETNESND